MKKTLKKIALLLTLAFAAIVLCISSLCVLNKGDKLSAEAAGSAPTQIKLETVGVTGALKPGDTFTLKMTISSSVTGTWDSVGLLIAPLTADGRDVDAEKTKYFSGGGAGTVVFEKQDGVDNFKNATYTKACSDKCATGAGINISMYLRNATVKPVATTIPIVVSITVTVKTTAPAELGNVTFGIAPIAKNSVSYGTSAGKVNHQANQVVVNGTVPDTSFVGDCMNIETCSTFVGTISSDNTLASMEVGHVAANNTVTVADDMTYSDPNEGDTIKIKPTLNHAKATMVYSIGASSTPTDPITSGTETSIDLDDSGITTVKFLVTAQDGSTKNYTLTIKSAYARLSALTAVVQRPSGAASVSGLGLTASSFNKETDTYTVNVTSDCTQLDITPTILANYGATGVDVAATGCTAGSATVASGSSVAITGSSITSGSSVKLTVTAADGTTKKDYTLNFTVVNVDTSLTDIKVVSGGVDVPNNAGKATANSVDYYFPLEESANFKGKLSITLGSTLSTVTVQGVAYNANTEYTADVTLQVVVTAEAGNTKQYKVMLKRNLKPGTINNLAYSVGALTGTVITDTDVAFDSGTDTYTLTKNLDPSTYAAGTVFNLTGTPSAGAGVTASSGVSGGQNGPWTKTLQLGKNEFSLTASTPGVGATTYKFVISLVEGKNTITDLKIYQGTAQTTQVPGFAFPGSLSVTVPFKDYDYINLAATTDGTYTNVVADVNGAAKDFTRSGTSHTLASVALTAGSTTTIKVYGWADNKQGNKGTEYTISITREAADNVALLQSLDVTVNGSPATFKQGAFNPATTGVAWEVEIPSDGSAAAAIGITAKAQSAKATVKIGSDPAGGQTVTFSESHTYTNASGNESWQYTIIVTPEQGSPANYTVKFTKKVPDPEFTDLQVSFVDQNGYTPVLTSGEYNSATNTYEVTKNISDVPVNSAIYVKGTTTSNATVTPTNLTGSGSPWNGSVAFGANNRYELTVRANGTQKKYTIIVKLIEDKYDINDVTIKIGSNNADDSFYFSSYTYNYDLTVPYSGSENVDITVTPNGTYTVVVDETHSKDLTKTASGYTLKLPLTAGKVNTVKIYAIADNKITGSNKSQTYTFNIEREAANNDATLSSLKVSVDGVELSSFDGGVTFDPATTTYTYTIEPTGNTTASIDIEATTQSDKSKVKIDTGTEKTQTVTANKVFTFGTSSHTDTYTITVTPESGTADKKEYKVQIKRVIAKGDFTDIEISTDGSYTSIINDFVDGSHTLTYNVSNVPDGTTFHVKPTTNSPDTKVGSLSNLTKNGDEYTGKLKFGVNTFKLSATSNGGNTPYTIIVNLVEDIDDIRNIEILNGTTPLDAGDFTFSPYSNEYNIDVPYTVAKLTVKVTPDGQFTVVRETGDRNLTKNGSEYIKEMTLVAGNKTTLVVYGVANNGTGKSDDPTAKGTSYTINVNRAAADASTTLDDLVVKINGNVMPFKDVATFDPNINDYVIEIEKEGTATSVSVEITATPTVTTSTVTGDGTKTFTFQTNKEHSSTYPIKVTAQSGATNTYNVTVKRIIIPGDFTTLEIASASTTFEDVFTSGNYDPVMKAYTVDLKMEDVGSSSTVRIKAVPTSGATVTSSGFTTTTAPSTNIWTGNLEHGKNEFTLTAKSATGEAAYTFVINLYEDKNTIERITLTAGGQTLPSSIFSFSKSETTYRFSVAYTVDTLKMLVTTNGSYITVADEMDNPFDVSGTNKKNHEKTISLDQGQITVLRFRAKSDRGEDGDWYEFEIERESANNDATLKSLSVTVGGKPYAFNEGEFDPARLDYSIQVDEGSYVGNITAVANNAKTKVTGTGSKTFKLSETTATYTYPITTEAEDGTTLTYNVTISLKPVELDSNYDITRISISGAENYYDGVPSTYGNIEEITVPYNEEKVKVVVSVANLKIKTNVDPALKSGYLELPAGETVRLTVYGVAEDGSNASGADAYAFDITRESPNSDAALKTLSVMIGGRPYSFTEGQFNPDQLTYTILVDENPSYVVNISATANNPKTKVTGTGTKTFNLSEITGTQMTYPIETEAEDGTKRTYNVIISQKPVVLDSNYDINSIEISNGSREYYKDLPARYNEPIQITVPNSESKVRVVVNTANRKATTHITPALTGFGYLDLPEDQTVTLVIYAVAEDGTNSDGGNAYIFEITRAPKGEVTGPDTTVTVGDDDPVEFELASTDPVIIKEQYGYATSKVDFGVDLAYGGTYEVLRITDDKTEEVVIASTEAGKVKKLPLDYGTNVFCVNIESSDGHSTKSVVLVAERDLPTLEGLSAVEIPKLRQDFKNNRTQESFSYTVGSEVSSLSLDVDCDPSLFYEIEGGDELEYGANEVKITIYEGNGRAIGNPLKTITLNVFREQAQNIFWFIMFWVMLAIVLIGIVIIIILANRNKHNGGGSDDSPIIVTSAPAPAQSAPPAQTIQPIIVQPTQTYYPPEDYLG